MSLKDRIIKNSRIKEAAVLEESEFFNMDVPITTEIPIINYALSGKIDGGLQPGVLTIAGKSKSFKTGFSLLIAKAFQEKYENGVIVFYDSEYGAPQEYWKDHGIDLSRVVHVPLSTVEQLNNDAYNLILNYDRKKDDPLLIMVDSLGNLASAKEAEDVKSDSDKADFTRPKKLRSFFRLMRPEVVKRGAYMVVINHTYDTMEMHAKQQISGGAGSIYNSDTIWVVSRRQFKNTSTNEIDGWDFNITLEKSRYIRESSKFPVSTRYDHGVVKWSGMFELALEFGVINESKKGWYTYVNDPEEKNRRKNDILYDDQLWNTILKETDLALKIKNKYSMKSQRNEDNSLSNNGQTDDLESWEKDPELDGSDA